MSLRIFQTGHITVGQAFVLDSLASRHVVQVMRARVDDECFLFNGDGSEYRATLSVANKNQAEVYVHECLPGLPKSPVHLHLGQVVSRGERMDYALQKATELGVAQITPLFSERCGVKLTGERLSKRQAHWQKVVLSAAQQCGRCDWVEVLPPMTVLEWLAACQASLKLVCAPVDKSSWSWPAEVSDAAVLIGPEGGLSQSELHCASDKGFLSWRIGPRVVRTETAPVVALTLLQWLYGDFGE
jgi:16S rRNA (uracil1498-N3)-methyltransferase